MIVLFIFSLCTLADIPSWPRSFKNINEHSYKSNESRQWPTSGIRPAIWSMTLWNHLWCFWLKKCHTLYWHATLNLPFECANYINSFSQFVFQLQRFYRSSFFYRKSHRKHFVPHSIFPTFSGWDAISRLIFEVDGGGGKQIFPISPQFPPLKNSPSHSKQKTPHLKFFHGSNLEHFASDYSIISFYLQWNANLEYQVPIFPFSVF